MKIKELKKELGISNKDIAEFFELNPISYANSSAKKRYENALCKFYAFVKSTARGQKENKTCTTVDLKNEQPLNLQNVSVFVCDNCKTETKHLKNGLCYGCNCLQG